jgi:hypothetical protein
MKIKHRLLLWLLHRDCDRLKNKINRPHMQSKFMLREEDESGIQLHEIISMVMIVVLLFIVLVIGDSQ